MTSLSKETIQSARKKGFWIVLLSILVICCAIFALGQLQILSIDINAIVKQMSWGPFLLSWIAMSCAFFFMGIRWSALLSCVPSPPKLELTALICAGLLLNYAAPGPVGELGAAWFAHRRYKISFGEALAAGVTARLIGLITACFLGAISWIFFSLPVEDKYLPMLKISVIASGFGGLALSWLAFFPVQFQSFVTTSTASSNRIWNKVRKMLEDIAHSVDQVSSLGPKAFLSCVLWSTCAHGSVILGIIFTAEALGSSYLLEGIIFTYALTTAAAVLLFALPGSYLGWDALFFGLLIGTAGVSTSNALTIAAIIRLQQFVFMLFGGISLSWLLRTTDQSESN